VGHGLRPRALDPGGGLRRPGQQGIDFMNILFSRKLF
jgi:hypothetical protein